MKQLHLTDISRNLRKWYSIKFAKLSTSLSHLIQFIITALSVDTFMISVSCMWKWSLKWTHDCPFNICYCSVAKLCLTLCDPVDCSMPDFPVLHCLLEFAQIHVHGVSDAIQPSHPLSPPFLPAFNLSQLQGLFQHHL